MNDSRSPRRPPTPRRSSPQGIEPSEDGTVVAVVGRRALAAAAAVTLAVTAAAACSGGFGVEDSDALVVHGRVIDSVTASPVAGAEVNVTSFSGNCGSNIFSNVSTSTDSSGRYGTSVINFRSGFRRCVEVQAEPPNGAGLQSSLIRVPDVPLNDDAVVDSLRLDIALDSVSGG